MIGCKMNKDANLISHAKVNRWNRQEIHSPVKARSHNSSISMYFDNKFISFFSTMYIKG